MKIFSELLITRLFILRIQVAANSVVKSENWILRSRLLNVTLESELVQLQ